ncbi:methyltransferase RsmF C-terminal domain-like protein [Parasediminibacterium sp. JCM 36343]|uniref:methyltransferase RsmF C-terminal domain-like protein n=1 Tax=Parasediminibacterium sp. JCM 36343 TaxID=3374279 RepID=UPI003979552C
MLPPLLIQSLQGIKGFHAAAFEAVHQSGEQVTSIRLNPAKPLTVDRLSFTERPFPLKTQNSKLKTKEIAWCPHGHYLAERPSFTLDPVFHAGAYYVQEASSMFLWHMLEQTIGNNTKGLKVLDLCAAPGGKSTLLASYFKDGLVISNEVIKARASVLVENITKWGSGNVVVTNNDPSHFKALENFFDVIVVDAPCSGSGLFRKDAQAIEEWSENNVRLCSQRQERIIADILPSLKENGILIYSTCSYSKAEDEDILDTLIDNQLLKPVPIPLQNEWGIVETLSDKHVANGYRFYPYLTKGEGFFIAAFIKTNGGQSGYYSEQKLGGLSKTEQQTINEFIHLGTDFSYFKQGDAIKAIETQWFASLQMLAKHLYIKKAGIELGTIKGKDVIPHHELALSYLPLDCFNKMDLDEEQALQYLRRQDFFVESTKGWNLVTHCGLPLGWAKVLPNRLNNYYPQAWRILKS